MQFAIAIFWQETIVLWKKAKLSKEPFLPNQTSPLFNFNLQVAIFWKVTVVFWQTAKKLQTANFPRNLSYLAHPSSVSVISLNLPITCLLYTSPSPRDGLLSRMPSSA